MKIKGNVNRRQLEIDEIKAKEAARLIDEHHLEEYSKKNNKKENKVRSR